MDKTLAVLLWPVGLAVILAVGALLAHRARPAAAGPGLAVGGVTTVDGVTTAPRAASGRDIQSAIEGAARFLAILLPGLVMVYVVMVLLGLIAVHAGPAIDKPVFHWTVSHQVHSWKEVMKRATQIGNTWTTRAAAVTASVCLAVTWRRMRWLPPLVFASLMVVQRVLTHAIHLTLHRPGPPGSHGTFPSGGTERAIVFYGLIAYLLWREFSGTRRAAIWAAAIVAALGFHEGYSRSYLAVHWLTDVFGGVVYGCLLLLLYIITVRLVAGPARSPTGAPVQAPAREMPADVPAPGDRA
jgi:membrane-associated phospholipid phosphatase